MNETTDVNIKMKIPDNVIDSRNACISHAEDLIKAAKRLLTDEKLPNIAYHLAVLALEEIGKSTLLMMGHFAETNKDTNWNPRKFYDDHIKKLFWATWGLHFGREKITRSQIESIQGLSKKIHETRLQGLYVDFDENGPFQPRDAISDTVAQGLINAVIHRIEFEKATTFGEISEKKISILRWFFNATSDKEKRNLIFGSKSMEKLVELESSQKWVEWLKNEFESSEKESKDALHKELKRIPPNDTQKFQDKWKIKIRLFSNSHSIRPNILSKWNEIGSWIKLYPVGGKKNQLIVDFTLQNSISVKGLWWVSWGAARSFVAALNIATFGNFWWYIPEQISRFYEKISDIENGLMDVRVERKPILKIDWKRGYLSNSDLRNSALCLSMMPKDNDSDLGKSMGAYLTALSFLNKSDIHIQFEANSYEFFYKSLKYGMKNYEEWDAKVFFPYLFEKQMMEYNFDKEELNNHKKIAIELETGNRNFNDVTLSLSEVALMKVVCDAYFLKKFNENAHRNDK